MFLRISSARDPQHETVMMMMTVIDDGDDGDDGEDGDDGDDSDDGDGGAHCTPHQPKGNQPKAPLPKRGRGAAKKGNPRPKRAHTPPDPKNFFCLFEANRSNQNC